MHGMNTKLNNPHNFTGGKTICDIQNTEVLFMCIMCVYVYTYINLNEAKISVERLLKMS